MASKHPKPRFEKCPLRPAIRPPLAAKHQAARQFHCSLVHARFVPTHLACRLRDTDYRQNRDPRDRYERTPAAKGSRNGVRPRRVQTAEGELEIQMPLLRDTAQRFVSKIIPDTSTVIRGHVAEQRAWGTADQADMHSCRHGDDSGAGRVRSLGPGQMV